MLHNHPKSNGIDSFSKNDFIAIRDNDAVDWYLVNEKFSYHLRKIKSLEGEYIIRHGNGMWKI